MPNEIIWLTPKKIPQLICIETFLSIETWNSRIFFTNCKGETIYDNFVSSFLEVDNKRKQVRHMKVRGQQKTFKKPETM